MAKLILIDSGFGLIRTALAQGGKLVDYYEESPDQGRTKGNIYKGVIKRVDANIQAAFVRYSGGRDGFLPLRDVPFRKGQAPVGPGDGVVVQVVKDEVGGKGAALTTKLSLSGRYLVYMPDKDGEGGVSSRLTDEERAAMKKALAQLQVPDTASVILRTAALHKPPEELQADLDRLMEAHRLIEEQAYDQKDPGLLFREPPPAYRYLREYYAPDVERIWVNDEEVLEECRQFFNLYEPRSAAKLSYSKDGALMFQRLGLEAEVEKLSSRKVGLPSGANFVIDQTEALVAIDVNSAKTKEVQAKPEGKGRGKGRDGKRQPGGLEQTVFAVNMEAGVEIARQLRLRDLGGIIVIDFIDMDEEKHRRKLEEAMRRALSEDKAKIKVFDISPLGLMQISRQRLRKAGALFSKTSCAACQGRGWHASPAAAAFAVLRRLEDKVQGRSGRNIIVTVPFPVANHILNDFREHVLALETRHGCSIRILADSAHAGEAVFAAGEEAPRPDAREAEKKDNRAARPSQGESIAASGEGRPHQEAQLGRDGRESRNGQDGRDGRPVQEGRVRHQGRPDREGRGRGRGKGRPDPIPAEYAGHAEDRMSRPPPHEEEPLEAVAADMEGPTEFSPSEVPVLDFPPPTEEPSFPEGAKEGLGLEEVIAMAEGRHLSPGGGAEAHPQGRGRRRHRGRGRGGKGGGGQGPMQRPQPAQAPGRSAAPVGRNDGPRREAVVPPPSPPPVAAPVAAPAPVPAANRNRPAGPAPTPAPVTAAKAAARQPAKGAPARGRGKAQAQSQEAGKAPAKKAPPKEAASARESGGKPATRSRNNRRGSGGKGGGKAGGKPAEG